MNERSFNVKSWDCGLDANPHLSDVRGVNALDGSSLLDHRLLLDFPPNRRYLIGISGGRDSVALLHLLRGAGYQKLIVCHLDHRLRGKSARADARFVATVARGAELDCEIGRTDVRALARQTRVSIETAARMARFAFFVSIARRRRCRTIFLAHHADDLVETALLNLFRGAGPAGIAALRGASAHEIGKTKLTLVRPLLHTWRSDIDRYVKGQRLKFREDASNAQLGSTRNRIRCRILPCIEQQFRRDVRRAIWRAAQIWGEEETFLESIIDNGSMGSEVSVCWLRDLPVALQRRAILRWLRLRDIGDLGFEVVERVRALLEPDATCAKVNLPRNRYARRRAGKLFIEG